MENEILEDLDALDKIVYTPPAKSLPSLKEFSKKLTITPDSTLYERIIESLEALRRKSI